MKSAWRTLALPPRMKLWPSTGRTGARRGKARKRRGLLAIERSEITHGGDDLVGGELAEASDAGDNVVPASKLFVCRDDGFDFGVDRPAMLANGSGRNRPSVAGIQS
nr:hypothetical protein [Sphingomonas oligophenolica]